MTEEIIKIVSDILEVEKSAITPDCDLMEALGADSIDIIEIVSIIEDDNGIVIPEDEIPEFRCVKDISAYVEAALARKE